MWCLDRWYSSHERAEEMRHWYVTEGAGETYIVMTNSENGGFGVLYEAPIPFSDWHAFGGDTQGRSTPSAPGDLRAVLDRMQNEGE
jgi:hypothetical protein